MARTTIAPIPVLSRAMAVATLLLTFVAGAMDAQTASIGGSVLNEVNERPIANAEIVFADFSRSVRADSAGKFLLTGVPLGKHSVVVRLPGYEPFTADLTFSFAKLVEVDFMLRQSSTKLKKVDVIAKAEAPFAIKLAEFEERRKLGIGKFITADVFEHEDGRPPSSFLRAHIAGLNVVQSGGRRWLASLRGNVGRTPFGAGGLDKVPAACYMQVILNGRVEYNGSPGQRLFDIDAINAKDIIGFEFYTVATTPLQYNGTSAATPCGTVVIWTKGG